MIYLIEPDNYKVHRQELDDMYRLRHKVFHDELKWAVESQNGMEKDEYDEVNTYYLVYKDEQGIIRGCQRYIEMKNPCMFDGPFRFLLADLKEFKEEGYWEASRLAVDHSYDENYTPAMAKKVCLHLLAASMYFGLELQNVKYFLTLSYPSIAKLLAHHGLGLSTLKQATINQESIVVSGYSPTLYSYEKLLKKLGKEQDDEPILWYCGPMYADQIGRAFYKKALEGHTQEETILYP